MTVRRRNCASGIVHDVAPTVERHLGLVLWVERRVVPLPLQLLPVLLRFILMSLLLLLALSILIIIEN